MSTLPDLPGRSPEHPGGVPPIPVRMLNEFVYCPRLAWLEWVAGEWADSSDTVDGRFRHRRIDLIEASCAAIHRLRPPAVFRGSDASARRCPLPRRCGSN